MGTIYTDTAATNGAIRWIKVSGTGNTGWAVEYGDTGWRSIARPAGLSAGGIALRRSGVRVEWVFDQITADTADQISIPVPIGFVIPSRFAVPIYRGATQMGAFDLNRATALFRPSAANNVLSALGGGSTADPWPSTLPGTPA